MGIKSKNKSKTISEVRLWVVKVVGKELYMPNNIRTPFTSFPTRFFTRKSDATNCIVHWVKYLKQTPNSIFLSMEENKQLAKDGLEIIEYSLVETKRESALPKMIYSWCK